MGKPRNWTGFYPWVRGDGAPIGENRTRLARLLGADESELMPKGDVSPQMRAAQTRSLNAKKHERKNGAIADTLERQLAETQPVLLPRAVIQPKAQDVLNYSVDSDGQAVVRLAARGPHGRMAALFRLLLDAGLVPGGEEEAA
jgi:hypothetical protein